MLIDKEKEIMTAPAWSEVTRTIRYFFTSILSLGAFVSAWIYLGLPQVASQNYVDDKFKVASEANREVKSQIFSARISLNRMTRQQLEAEQYRLTQQAKTDSSFEIQRRLHDIQEELNDTADERKRLLGPGN